MGAQPHTIEQYKKRPRVSIQRERLCSQGPRHSKETLWPRLQSVLMGQGCGQEAIAVASLLTFSTSLRTRLLLWSAHDARATGLHVTGEMLRHLVEFPVAATTEEGYPQMLPCMTIGCGGVLVHHATIWAECYLLPLVVIIIDRHPGQAFRLVELVNHIFPVILKWHIWLYDGYQWAISLGVEEWAQARYLLGDTGSCVQWQPFICIFEGIGFALGQVTFAVKVVDPILTYDSWRMSFIDHLPQLKVR